MIGLSKFQLMQSPHETGGDLMTLDSVSEYDRTVYHSCVSKWFIMCGARDKVGFDNLLRSVAWPNRCTTPNAR